MGLFRHRHEPQPQPQPGAGQRADDAYEQVADATREIRLALERMAPALDRLPGIVAPRKDPR